MTNLIRYALVAAGLAAVVVALADDRVDAINKTRSSVALKGYDPVAYFKQEQPVKGTPQYTNHWMGATWQFASADARDTFAASPDKYAPQYGGYCAWAVSRGYTADADPEAWKVVNGKLYLNYSKSVQRKWEGDIPGNIAKADGNWPGLHN
jgi:hypothetical protein